MPSPDLALISVFCLAWAFNFITGSFLRMILRENTCTHWHQGLC